MGKFGKKFGFGSKKKGGGNAPARPTANLPNSVMQERLREAMTPQRPARAAPLHAATDSGEGSDLLEILGDHSGEGPAVETWSSSEGSSTDVSEASWEAIETVAAPQEIPIDRALSGEDVSASGEEPEWALPAPPILESALADQAAWVRPPMPEGWDVPEQGENLVVGGFNFGSESSETESSEESGSVEEAPKKKPALFVNEEGETHMEGGLRFDLSESGSESSEESSEESSSEEEGQPVAPPLVRQPVGPLVRGDGKSFAKAWGENSELAALKGPAVPAPDQTAPDPEPWRHHANVSMVPLRPGETRYAADGKTEEGRTHWEPVGTQGAKSVGAYTPLYSGIYYDEQTDATHLPSQVVGARAARTHYNTDDERAETELTGHRGRLVPKVDQNLPVDTRGFGSFVSAVGNAADKANFAIADGGALYAMNPRWGEAQNDKEMIASHHSSLVAGENVATAGEIRAEHGRVKEVSNSSGHYRPEEYTILQGLEAMDAKGIDLSMAQVKSAGAGPMGGVGELGRAGPYLEAMVGQPMPHAPYVPRKKGEAVSSPVTSERASLAGRSALQADVQGAVAGRAAVAEGVGAAPPAPSLAQGAGPRAPAAMPERGSFDAWRDNQAAVLEAADDAHALRLSAKASGGEALSAAELSGLGSLSGPAGAADAGWWGESSPALASPHLARAESGAVDTAQARARAEAALRAAVTPQEREDATFALSDVIEQADWDKVHAKKA